MLERTVEAHLVKVVKAAGGEIRKVSWGPMHRGAPDRFVMFPWGCCFIELKRPGKKAEAHQEREHARMRRLGQKVLVLDSIEAIDEWMSNEHP